MIDREIFRMRKIGALTFNDALHQYILSMKLLIMMADNVRLDKLKDICEINRMFRDRMESIIKLREIELELDEPTLYELMKSIDDKEDA